MTVQINSAASTADQEFGAVTTRRRLLAPGGADTSFVFAVGEQPVWLEAYGPEGTDEIIVQMVGGEYGSTVVETFRPAGGRNLRLSERLTKFAIIPPGRYRLFRRTGAAAVSVYGFPGSVTHDFDSYYQGISDLAEPMENEVILSKATSLGTTSLTVVAFDAIIRDTTDTITVPTSSFSVPWNFSQTPNAQFVEFEALVDFGTSVTAGHGNWAITKNGTPVISSSLIIPDGYALGSVVALKGRLRQLADTDVLALRYQCVTCAPTLNSIQLRATLVGV